MEKCAFARTIKANHTGQCQLYLGIELAIWRILDLFVNAIDISYANAYGIIEMPILGSVLLLFAFTQLSTFFSYTTSEHCCWTLRDLSISSVLFTCTVTGDAHSYN